MLAAAPKREPGSAAASVPGGYLDERAQVVLLALLVASGHDMDDHPESKEHGCVTLGALLLALNSTRMQPRVIR